MNDINKSATISIRINKKDAEALKKIATNDMQTVSEFLRELIKKTIKKSN